MSMPGLAEEAGFAYKNINDVIDAVAQAGISKPVVGLTPVGNIKGTANLNIIILFFVILFVLFLILVL